MESYTEQLLSWYFKNLPNYHSCVICGIVKSNQITGEKMGENAYPHFDNWKLKKLRGERKKMKKITQETVNRQ